MGGSGRDLPWWPACSTPLLLHPLPEHLPPTCRSIEPYLYAPSSLAPAADPEGLERRGREGA